MTVLERLQELKDAIDAAHLPYATEVDEAATVVVVRVPLENRQRKTGPVMRAILEAGLRPYGARATKRGMELFVEAFPS
jgi:hypothetical protein